ncbi:MAG: DUF4832 domain-containing protein [Armatimonadota bacterium]
MLHRACLLFAVAALLIGVACAQETAPVAPGPQLVEFTPTVSNDVLFNPRMGLYLQPPADLKDDEWLASILSVYYTRVDWSTLNPEEGVYTFDQYFAPLLDFCKQHHLRLAFGVMSESMHSNRPYVTPKWVFDKGVPGVQHKGLYEKGKVQTDPVFWDPRYMDLQVEFIKKLGEYFADKSDLEYVDLRGIGEWGEMHLMRWTSQQLQETGFSESAYALAYRRMIDAYHDAFPHTQLFLNIGGQDHQSINDYAAIRGVNFRQDGLLPSGGSYDCGEWLFKPYSRRGVVCNYEFCLGYEEMVQKNLDVLATIRKGLEAPISYLHANLFWGGSIRQAPQEIKDALTDAARRLGYRFVLTSVKHLPQLKLAAGRGSRLPLEVTWRNDGVAPCYDSFMTRWLLVDAAGKTVAQQDLFPRVPTTQWWPGESNTEQFLLRVPAGVAPGSYTLKVMMLLPETNRRILLGIAGREADDRYALCAIPAIAGEDTTGVPFETGFETEDTPWTGVAGMKTSLVTDGAHSGQKALLVAGTAEKSWNYAMVRVPKPIAAFGKYRFSAWMKVEECPDKQPAPYLKIGVNDAKGKWITNFSTEQYDLTKPGTWQLLEGLGDLPASAYTVDLAVETGDVSRSLTMKLLLDDVKVELLEAP